MAEECHLPRRHCWSESHWGVLGHLDITTRLPITTTTTTITITPSFLFLFLFFFFLFSSVSSNRKDGGSDDDDARHLPVMAVQRGVQQGSEVRAAAPHAGGEEGGGA